MGNDNNGWIKIHRSILDWEWWTDVSTAHFFVHCLLRANVEPKRWHGKEIPRGSFITTRAAISSETGLTERQVRTAIEHLTQSGEIQIDTSTNHYTLVTICKFEHYQTGKRKGDQPKEGLKSCKSKENEKNNIKSDQPNAIPPTNQTPYHRPTTDQPNAIPPTYTKEIKEYKENKEGEEIETPPTFEYKSPKTIFLEEFVSHYKKTFKTEYIPLWQYQSDDLAKIMAAITIKLKERGGELPKANEEGVREYIAELLEKMYKGASDFLKRQWNTHTIANHFNELYNATLNNNNNGPEREKIARADEFTERL